MPIQRPALLAAALAAFLAWLLYRFAGVLAPFVVGLVIAYLIAPLVERLARAGLGRVGATILVFVAFGSILFVVLVMVVPAVTRESIDLAQRAPDLLKRLAALASDWSRPLQERLGLEPLAGAGLDSKRVLSELGEWAKWGGRALAGFLTIALVAPVVAFYLVIDWRRLVVGLFRLVPPRHRRLVAAVAGEIDGVVRGFLTGQALVATIMALAYAVALASLGLASGLVIGLAAGLLGMVPYLGAIIGIVVAGGVALAQAWPDWTLPAAVLAVFVAGQFIEGNILGPRLVGDRVRLHPVWMMVALVVFGSIGGFAGLVVAVPVAGAIGVLARRAAEHYVASRWYDDGSPPAAPEAA